MPKGSKKRRALRKKEAAAAAAAAAAAREKPENEASSMASSEENSTVMLTEIGDGVVTAVFDEPSVVFPKRIVLPEKMLASEVVDLRRKDAEEGIKEDALPTEISSSVQSLNTAAPLETSQADKIDVVVESSVVAEPCIIELESQDEDDGSIMPTDACDSEGKGTKDATKDLQDDNGGSVMASEVAAFLVITDNAVKSLTTVPCHLDLNATESLNAVNEVFTSVDAAVDQRAMELKNEIAAETKQDLVITKNWVALEIQDEVFTNVGDVVDQSAVENKKDNAVETKQDLIFSKNRVALENQEIAALNVEVAPVEYAPAKTEEAFLVVEAVVQNKKDAILEDAKTEEAFLVVEAAVQNKKDAILEDAKTEEAFLVVEAAVQNKKDAILEDAKTEEAFLVVEAAVQNKKDAILEDAKTEEAFLVVEAAVQNKKDAILEDAKTEEAFLVVEAAVQNKKDAILEDAITEEAFLVVEAAVQNKKDAMLEDVNENDAVAENLGNAALNVVDALKKTEGDAWVDEALKNKEVILEDVNEIYKNSFEAIVEDQITAASEVDAFEKTGDDVPVVEVEAVFSARPAVDAICQTHDAVSAVPVTPEVVKQLKEIKEIVEDVLNRLIAIDALLN